VWWQAASHQATASAEQSEDSWCQAPAVLGNRATGRASRHNGAVPTTLEPVQVEEPAIDDVPASDRPWVVIVWNDPINLMSYVAFVLQKLFGYSAEKANELMLDVHHKGKAVVANGNREEAEMHVFHLHEHSLWATMQHDD
jgi:ATP-dependent Clp protease adaptor protein ClpS